MTQEEFLTKLFSLYAATFNRGNGQQWIDAYKQVLKPNIDYDALYDFMLCNYSGSSAPSPAFLIKNATFVKTPTDTKYPEFETLIAEKNGYPYEFGIETNYTEAVRNLTQRGFKNIRLKFQKERFV